MYAARRRFVSAAHDRSVNIKVVFEHDELGDRQAVDGRGLELDSACGFDRLLRQAVAQPFDYEYVFDLPVRGEDGAQSDDSGDVGAACLLGKAGSGLKVMVARVVASEDE